MRGCGLFLILLGLVLMFGVGFGAAASESIRQPLAPIFCSAEEQFVTDSQVDEIKNQTRFYCESDDRQIRNVTGRVILFFTLTGLAPILLGAWFLGRNIPSRQEHNPTLFYTTTTSEQPRVFAQKIIIHNGKQQVFTSDRTNNQTFTGTMDMADMGISFDGSTFKMPGIEIRLDELPQMENRETIRQDTLRQLQEARDAGLISEEEFERFRQNLDTI